MKDMYNETMLRSQHVKGAHWEKCVCAGGCEGVSKERDALDAPEFNNG